MGSVCFAYKKIFFYLSHNWISFMNWASFFKWYHIFSIGLRSEFFASQSIGIISVILKDSLDKFCRAITCIVLLKDVIPPSLSFYESSNKRNTASTRKKLFVSEINIPPILHTSKILTEVNGLGTINITPIMLETMVGSFLPVISDIRFWLLVQSCFIAKVLLIFYYKKNYDFICCLS